MSAQTKQTNPDDLGLQHRPIELLTENGYAIVRPWEINQLPAPTTGTYSFLVQKEQDLAREIVVTIADELFADVGLRTRGRISVSCSFWIGCAERHLANYLWEKDDFPAGNSLTVDYLDPDDIIAAVCWHTETRH